MNFERVAPNVSALLQILNNYRVKYVVIGSVAAQLWGADVGQPGDLDIVPAMTWENLMRFTDALGAMDATPFPATGEWVERDGEYTWQSFADNDPRYRQILPIDPAVPASFDTLYDTRYGTLDSVPKLAGTYPEIDTQASTLLLPKVGETRVMSLEMQLAHLTVPRRAKDAPRVRQLRAIQLRQLRDRR